MYAADKPTAAAILHPTRPHKVADGLSQQIRHPDTGQAEKDHERGGNGKTQLDEEGVQVSEHTRNTRNTHNGDKKHAAKLEIGRSAVFAFALVGLDLELEIVIADLRVDVTKRILAGTVGLVLLVPVPAAASPVVTTTGNFTDNFDARLSPVHVAGMMSVVVNIKHVKLKLQLAFQFMLDLAFLPTEHFLSVLQVGIAQLRVSFVRPNHTVLFSVAG